jgi:uncharacterized membrane protein YhaH (DUF805 family)
MLMPYRKLYPAIAGRSSRREYWMFVLFNLIVLVVFAALFFAFAGGAASLDPSNLGGAMIGAGMGLLLLLFIPFYIWALVTAAASLAVTVRRFHDLNLSGWIYVLFIVLGFIPFVNLLSFIALVVMMCLRGTQGPNKYGEDPTDVSGAEVFA